MANYMGSNNLQIGSLYKYDIFAAFPCYKLENQKIRFRLVIS
jgi:hypothetical protein